MPRPISPVGTETPPEPTIRPEPGVVHRARKAEALEHSAARITEQLREARAVAGPGETRVQILDGETGEPVEQVRSDGGWNPEPAALRDGETRDTMGHATRNAEQLASVAAEIRLEPGDRVAIDGAEDTARVVGVSGLRAGEHQIETLGVTVSEYNGCGADERVYVCRFVNASGYSKEYPYPESRLKLDVRVPEVNE